MCGEGLAFFAMRVASAANSTPEASAETTASTVILSYTSETEDLWQLPEASERFLGAAPTLSNIANGMFKNNSKSTH